MSQIYTYESDRFTEAVSELGLGNASNLEDFVCRARFYDRIRRFGSPALREKTMRLLKEVIKSPQREKIITTVAKSYLFVLNGEIESAHDIWKKYTSKHPTDFRGWHQMGHITSLTGSPSFEDELKEGEQYLPQEYSNNVPSSVWLGVSELRETPNMGVGIFSLKDFKKGEVICPFLSGKIIHCQFTKYIHAIQIDDIYHLDHSHFQFINHSCDPNVAVVDQNFVAWRDIKTGDQLTWDYSTSMDDEEPWDLICLCGTSKCRGKIQQFIDLDKALQKEYLDAGVVFPFIASHYHKVYHQNYDTEEPGDNVLFTTKRLMRENRARV